MRALLWPRAKRVCEAILADLRIVRRQEVSGVLLEHILAGPAGDGAVVARTRGRLSSWVFDDCTMMYEGDAKDWEAQVHRHGDQLRR